jgi:hypothetical protein
MSPRLARSLFVLGAVFVTVCPRPAAAQIQVEVNRQPVRFGAVRPAQIGGRVLIPLRAVVEALGAEVRWNAATQTVHGRKGDRTFDLPIGSRTVTVGGSPMTLDVPAQLMSGTTMVPLRFVAEALGAEVEWNAAAMRVAIALPEQPAPGPEPGRAGPVVGEVVAVRPGDNPPTLTILDNGIRATYPLAADALVLRGEPGKPGVTVRLGSVQVGDRVRVRLDPEGRTAEVVEASGKLLTPPVPDPAPRPAPEPSGPVVGEVVGVRPNDDPPTVTVRVGGSRVTFPVKPDAVVLRGPAGRRGAPVDLNELQAGDQIRIRLDAATRTADIVEAFGAASNPAPVPEPAPGADLRIRSLTHNAGPVVAAGREVRVTMLGTPGGQASFDVGGLARDVAMVEDPQQPGRYHGTFRLQGGVTARDLAILGVLRKGNFAAPLVQAAGTITLDSQPPAITDPAPEPNSSVETARPEIYAEIGDRAGTGLDPSTIRLRVRGQDVTDQARITKRYVLYTPPSALRPGPVQVSLEARDMAGNRASRSWRFTIEREDSPFESISHDAVRPLRAGDVVTVRAKAKPGAKATFSLGDFARGLPMEEAQPGVYVGKYTVRRGDEATQAPVVVDLQPAGGPRVRQKAAAPVNLVTQPPTPPAITAPAKDAVLGESLVVEGSGTPGAKVRVETSFTGKAFGALPVSGTFGSQEVAVDKTGHWATEPFTVRFPLGTRRPQVTVRAITIDAAGQESAAAETSLQAR